MRYEFDSFVFDTEVYTLERDGEPVEISRQVFNLIQYLIEQRDRIVPQQELLDKLWSGRFVTPNALSQALRIARRAIGADAIETTYGRGLRFVKRVKGSTQGCRFVPETDCPSVLFLPFRSLSGMKELELFGATLTEDLIAQATSFKSFSILDRNVSFSYKDQWPDVRKLGLERDVNYIVSGTVRMKNGSLRITVTLTDAKSTKQIWARSFARIVDNDLLAGVEIAEEILSLLISEWWRFELKQAARKQNLPLDPWSMMMRGHWHLLRMSREDLSQARFLLRQVLDLDPTWAEPLSNLALTYAYDFYGEQAESALSKALSFAERAVATDPQNCGSLSILGSISSALGQHDRGISHHRRALDLVPGFIEGIWLYGHSLAEAGHPEDAIAQIEKAIELGANSPWLFNILLSMGTAHFTAGNYAETIRWARRSLSLRQDYPYTYVWLASAYGQLGRIETARRIVHEFGKTCSGLDLKDLEDFRPSSYHAFADSFQEGLLRATG